MYQSAQPTQSTLLPTARPDGLTDTVSYVLLAQILRIKVDTLWRWVKSGRIIQPNYFGSQARWTVDQVKRIVAEGTKPEGHYTRIKKARKLKTIQRSTTPGRTRPQVPTHEANATRSKALAATVQLHKGRKRR